MKISRVFFFFFFFLASAFFCSCSVSAAFSHRQSVNPLNFILGNENLDPLNDGILGDALAPGPALSEPKIPLKLAGNQTKRPDVLRKFRIYQGGWDISNKHYWASVAFTGVAEFVIMLVWLVLFGIMLLVHHCFGWGMTFKDAVSDSCMAMQEWVENPRAETALSNILPCVDESATNHTLSESRKVVHTVVDTINTYIYTAANTDRPPSDQFYYNQSGPSMPPLCFPFDDKLNERDCFAQEVSMTNASMVWAKYICTTTMDSKNCTSVGRVTPEVYSQLVMAVNASYAVLHYTPEMLDLQNCNFLRDIFMTITSRYCPLEHYLLIVIVGLGFISAGIMLCLILWFVYANRPRREEVFAKTPSIINNNNNHRLDDDELHQNKDTMVSLVVASPRRVVPDIEK